MKIYQHKKRDTNRYRIYQREYKKAKYYKTERYFNTLKKKSPIMAEHKYHIKKVYGMTQEEYRLLLAKQGGVCAICGRPERGILRGKIRMLGVDHNHITGKIRGLLCTNCNTALGLVKENPTILVNMISYIEREECGQ
jgi:hypothetical protein